MKLEELYNNIKNNIAVNQLIIFENNKNNFIANQYIDAIAEINQARKIFIDDLADIRVGTSIFDTFTEPVLYIYKIEKFSCETDDYCNIENLIISCDKIDKTTAGYYKDYIIKIPELEEWQIKDYIYSQLDGMKPENLDSLYNMCNKDIFRIKEEVDRLKIFPANERDFLFYEFSKDKIYDDLTTYTVFNFINAIAIKDIDQVGKIYKELKNIDSNALGIAALLYNNFKNIILIQCNKVPTPESCNMKSGQFWAINKIIGHYTQTQLQNIFLLITDIDRKLKLGEIDIDTILDYLLVNIFTA